MKILKINDVVESLLKPNNLNSVVLLEDKLNISVDDRLELVTKANASIGMASVVETRMRKISDIGPDEVELTQQLEQLTYEYELNDSNNAKILLFEFEPYKTPKKLDSLSEESFEHVKMYSDGGSRGNPGPSASGYVILTMSDKVIHEEGVYLGITTNNQAEYMSLKFGLTYSKQIGAKEVSVFMDSQLVINQMNGVYKIKHPDLIPIYRDIKQLQSEFDKVTFTHVPRELNKLADTEVNKCLDKEANR